MLLSNLFDRVFANGIYLIKIVKDTSYKLLSNETSPLKSDNIRECVKLSCMIKNLTRKKVIKKI